MIKETNNKVNIHFTVSLVKITNKNIIIERELFFTDDLDSACREARKLNKKMRSHLYYTGRKVIVHRTKDVEYVPNTFEQN
jgi:ribosomal protein L31